MTSPKRYDRIAFVASAGEEAQQALAQLEELYGNRDPADADVRATVHEAIDALDRGEVRVAEIDPDTRDVTVNIWLKAAILLFSRSLSWRPSS